MTNHAYCGFFSEVSINTTLDPVDADTVKVIQRDLETIGSHIAENTALASMTLNDDENQYTLEPLIQEHIEDMADRLSMVIFKPDGTINTPAIHALHQLGYQVNADIPPGDPNGAAGRLTHMDSGWSIDFS